MLAVEAVDVALERGLLLVLGGLGGGDLAGQAALVELGVVGPLQRSERLLLLGREVLAQVLLGQWLRVPSLDGDGHHREDEDAEEETGHVGGVGAADLLRTCWRGCGDVIML